MAAAGDVQTGLSAVRRRRLHFRWCKVSLGLHTSFAAQTLACVRVNGGKTFERDWWSTATWAVNSTIREAPEAVAISVADDHPALPQPRRTVPNLARARYEMTSQAVVTCRADHGLLKPT